MAVSRDCQFFFTNLCGQNLTTFATDLGFPYELSCAVGTFLGCSLIKLVSGFCCSPQRDSDGVVISDGADNTLTS